MFFHYWKAVISLNDSFWTTTSQKRQLKKKNIDFLHKFHKLCSRPIPTTLFEKEDRLRWCRPKIDHFDRGPSKLVYNWWWNICILLWSRKNATILSLGRCEWVSLKRFSWKNPIQKDCRLLFVIIVHVSTVAFKDGSILIQYGILQFIHLIPWR